MNKKLSKLLACILCISTMVRIGAIYDLEGSLKELMLEQIMSCLNHYPLIATVNVARVRRLNL